MQSPIGLSGCSEASLTGAAVRPAGWWALARLAVAATVVFGAVTLTRLATDTINGRASGSNTPWEAHLRRVDDALARNDVPAAERAWHQAYLAALGSRRWEGRIDVGDAALRIGGAAGTREAAQARARANYLAALLQARDGASLEGVLRAAQAFAALGDRAIVDQCLRIADGLASEGRDAGARDRVRTLREHLTTRFAEVEGAP